MQSSSLLRSVVPPESKRPRMCGDRFVLLDISVHQFLQQESTLTLHHLGILVLVLSFFMFYCGEKQQSSVQNAHIVKYPVKCVV